MKFLSLAISTAGLAALPTRSNAQFASVLGVSGDVMWLFGALPWLLLSLLIFAVFIARTSKRMLLKRALWSSLRWSCYLLLTLTTCMTAFEMASQSSSGVAIREMLAFGLMSFMFVGLPLMGSLVLPLFIVFYGAYFFRDQSGLP